MHLSRATRNAYLAMACCVPVAAVCRSWGTFHPESGNLNLGAFVSFTCLLLVWARRLHYRFVRREVLTCLTTIAALLVALFFMQTVRYEFSTSLPTVRHLLWYAYYVPIIFVPAILLLAVLHIGRPREWRLGRAWLLAVTIAAALSLAVLTNDLHQQAFRFGVGTSVDKGEGAYAHGLLFYAIWVWVAIMGVLSVVVALRRTARVAPRMGVLAPAGVVVAMVILLPQYGLGGQFFLDTYLRFPDAVCLFMVAFIESLVALGLFPANDGYEALWRASSLRGGFVDGAGRLVNQSAGAPRVEVEQVRKALDVSQTLDDGHSELVALTVPGGVAYWVRDLARIQSLQRRLEDVGETLAQEQAIIEAENALAQRGEALAHRQELLERIRENTEPQLKELEAALDHLPQDEDSFLQAMRLAAVPATYLKRCANLTLLADAGADEANGQIDVRELLLAFEESLQCLRACGVDAQLQATAEGMVPAQEALRSYAAFQQVVEGLLPAWTTDVAPHALVVSCQTDAGELAVRLFADGRELVASEAAGAPRGGDAS